MINPDLFSKISYGLYVVCSGNRFRGTGFVANTVFQVTSKPPRFAVCCNKDNYTSDFIKQYKAFSVSVLSRDVSSDLINRFGYKSGRDIDKFSNLDVMYGESGVPILKNESLAYFECTLIDAFDVGTHLIFIGELLNGDVLDLEGEPLTYDYYHKVKKGVAPKNAPTYVDRSLFDEKTKSDKMVGLKKYECTACGYVYNEADEKIPFADLPDDWECPICGAKKSEFEEIL